MIQSELKHETMRKIWQDHLFAEFSLQDAEVALATLSENPHVVLVPCGVAAIGQRAVRDFYLNHFIPNLPPDIEILPLTQTIAEDRVIDEVVIRFTHTLRMDWMIPGVPPTNRTVEVAVLVIHQIENGKITSEHLYWDQATVLSQLGVLNNPVAAAGMNSTPQLLKLFPAEALVL